MAVGDKEGGGRQHKDSHAGEYDSCWSSNSRGVEHAMEGGGRPKASSKTKGARRPETLMGRVWLRGVDSDQKGSIP